MAKALTSTIKFESRGGSPVHGLALLYDLEGFSRFFNQPDVQDYVPKFLGDGMLYVWTLRKGDADFDPAFITDLCNRLRNLKLRFAEVLKRAADDVPVVDLPSRIRFGLARGT